jgi:catechol 2,3-dioxygenase-like lactoylglutathione lyase family enzyme
MQTARARATATDNRMLTALSNERDGHRRHAGKGNLHGSPRPRGHMMVAGFVALLGAFVTTAGAGSGNGFVSAIGVAIAISAGVYAVFTVAQRRLASMVPGTAHIVSATAPPAAATHGRCEMHLVVQAPRLMATAVRHRDGSVPVAKWPTPGGTLPVVVDPRDPRDLRIRWDKVRPHGETAPDYDPKHEAQAEHRPTGSPQPKLIPDDDLEILADATGVSSSTTGSVTTPGDVLVGSDGAAADTSALGAASTPLVGDPGTGSRSGNGASPLDGDVTALAGDTASPLSEFFDASDGEPVDLSFLDPPKFGSLVERDPLLIEYGSPIREVGVTLIVSDLKQSLEFYRDVLGFFEIESGPDMVLLEARTGRLVLRQRDDAEAKPPRLMHLTLEVNDIDTAHRTLTKRGIEFIDEPRTVLKGELLELWAVSFHDPDGHGVALTSWLPRESTDA